MVKEEFFYACQKGYLATVSEALQENPALVCEQDACGRTPLHYACGSGHVAVAQYLIQKGAHVKAKDRRGETPVQLAQRYKFTSLLNVFGHFVPQSSSSVGLDAEVSGDIEGA